MAMQATPSPITDMAGLGFSALCVIHCLALPLLAAALPILGAIAEMEVIHRGFVVFAAFAAVVGLLQASSNLRVVFGAIAAIGLTLLIAGAFVEAFHDIEVPLTVAGALVLSAAHIIRWRYNGVGGPASHV